MIKKILSLGILILSSMLLNAQDRPNVIFIFADDLGWGDLHCYGHPYAKTPNLDELAREGIRFERFYVTGVTCCPSRTGIMTSRHPASYPKYMAGYGFAGNITLTDIFHQNGYVTGHFGKWHIGSKKSEVNGTYGIDEVEVIGGNKTSEQGRDVDLYSEALKFIEHHKNEPFYVNIWGHITHYPVDPVTSLAEVFKDVDIDRRAFGMHMQEKFDDCEDIGGNVVNSMRNYLGDVYSLDLQVGRVMKKLDELGIAENTIVIFSSDQGPAPVKLGNDFENSAKMDAIGDNTGIMPSQNMLGYAGGFRGGKHTQFEGGVRSPLIIRWPAKIQADIVNRTSVVSGLDFIPTLSSILGMPIESEKFEGEDMSEVWLGGRGQRSTPLFWRTSSENASPSMLDGYWKMHKKGNNYELYDLYTDDKELYDVADKYPEVVKEMSKKMEEWVATLPRSYVK